LKTFHCPLVWNANRRNTSWHFADWPISVWGILPRRGSWYRKADFYYRS
jgi:hypothetical protein